MKNKVIISMFIGFMFIAVSLVHSATFTVNTSDDTVDVNPGDGAALDTFGKCSIRAAIMEANALVGEDTINIPEGVFELIRNGIKEDKCRRGDLDITSKLEIKGAGKEITIIDGKRLDRVFHVIGKCEVIISDLTIQGGKTSDVTVCSDEGDTYAENGGGILNTKGNLTIVNCTIRDNITGSCDATCNRCIDGSGGGLYNDHGVVMLSNCIVKRNQTGKEKEFWGDLGNQRGYGVPGDGGGLYNNKGTLFIKDSDIFENKTGIGSGDSMVAPFAGEGAGIFNIKGNLIVERCTISGNVTGFDKNTNEGSGGGVVNTDNGNALIESSTISRNSSGGTGLYYYDFGSIGKSGGGGVLNSRSELTMINCTVSGNRTAEKKYIADEPVGGGIYNVSAKLKLINCTITNNVSYYGGGIISINSAWRDKSIVNFKNTIIAGNKLYKNGEGRDIYGKLNSQGYNLIEKLAGGNVTGNQTGNIYNQDPLLDSLADNGGPTETHVLLEGSPAIDAGDPEDFEETDQRGVLRPKDGDDDGIAIADIGAFERSLPSVSITSPISGSTVFGTVTIGVNVINADQLMLYIDGKLVHTFDSEPYIFDWDTSPYTNRSYQIKALVSDKIGGTAEDEITVYVRNVIINLSASRQGEQAWIIKRAFGKITFTVMKTGFFNISKYIIYRKGSAEVFQSIKEVSVSDLQEGLYAYNDLFPDENETYTYKVKALDGSGMVIGCSKEETVGR